MRHHAEKLRPLELQDPRTVQLTGLVQARRGMVDRRTGGLNQLTRLLKTYYPQALQLLEDLHRELAVAFLDRWPDLLSLKKSKPASIKRFYDQYNVRCGTLTSLYPDPASLPKYVGVAPVREKSGNQLWTHWRWGAPTFRRPTFTEWAGPTVRYSAWARVSYERMLKLGKKHAVILRALAFTWIRVLRKCWQTQTPYDEGRYLQQLLHRKSPNAVSEQLMNR